jgi:hypothetical protein
MGKLMPIVLDSFCPERAFLYRLLLAYKRDFTLDRAKPEDAGWVLQYWLDIAFPTIPMTATRFVYLCTGEDEQGIMPSSLLAAPTDPAQADE